MNTLKIEDQYAMYFITCTVVGWVDLFTREQCRKIIVDSLRFCQNNKGLTINAYVIMSNHLHLVVRANQESKGLSAIIRDFKRHTAKKLHLWFETSISNRESRGWVEMVFKYHALYNKRNKNYQVWVQDNHPIILYSPKIIFQKINYIHQNPVQAGIVARPEHYLYSSASHYLGTSRSMLDVEIIDFGSIEGYVPS